MSSELRSLSTSELKDKKIDLQKKMHTLRFDSVMGNLSNVAELRLVRREVARINTVLREQELGLSVSVND